MTERRKFNVASLSELFVLLAIVFMVQTVVNVALSDGISSPPEKPMTMVTISQFATEGDTIDHLRYITVGSQTLRFEDASCAPGTFAAGGPKSAIVNGQCLRLSPTPGITIMRDEGAPSAIEQFQTRILLQYGVRVAVQREQGFQTKITLVFEPQVAESIDIHVGLCLCGLPMAEEELVVPRGLNITQARFERPHPLIVQVMTVKSRAKLTGRAFYGHMNDVVTINDTTQPLPLFAETFSYEGEGCIASSPNELIRDVKLVWPDIGVRLQDDG